MRVSRRHVLAGAAALPFAALPFATAVARPAAAAEAALRVGVGLGDVTGPAAENGMMGYSLPQQQTAGIHLRT